MSDFFALSKFSSYFTGEILNHFPSYKKMKITILLYDVHAFSYQRFDLSYLRTPKHAMCQKKSREICANKAVSEKMC